MPDTPRPPAPPYSPLARECAALYAAANELVKHLLTTPIVAGQAHPMTTPAGRRAGHQLRAFRAYMAGSPDLRKLVEQFSAADWLSQLDASAAAAGPELPPGGVLDVPGQLPLPGVTVEHFPNPDGDAGATIFTLPDVRGRGERGGRR